jgi:hypothetical protein
MLHVPFNLHKLPISSSSNLIIDDILLPMIMRCFLPFFLVLYDNASADHEVPHTLFMPTYTKRLGNSLCLVAFFLCEVYTHAHKLLLIFHPQKTVDPAFVLWIHRTATPKSLKHSTKFHNFYENKHTTYNNTTQVHNNREGFERCKIDDSFLLHWSSLCCHMRHV